MYVHSLNSSGLFRKLRELHPNPKNGIEVRNKKNANSDALTLVSRDAPFVPVLGAILHKFRA